MYKIILILFLLLSMKSQAQISEVKVSNGYAKIYEKGTFTNSIYLNSKKLVGYNNNFVVIQDGQYVKIFDNKGRFTGHSIYLNKSKSVTSVTLSSILIKDGNYTKYYDFKGNFTGHSTFNN